MIETTSLTLADLALAVRLRRAFDEGRATANARSRARLNASTAAVRRSLDVDIIEGRAVYGRASRLARKLRMNRRTVARILATLLSVSK
jgi:hypothetical protein